MHLTFPGHDRLRPALLECFAWRVHHMRRINCSAKTMAAAMLPGQRVLLDSSAHKSFGRRDFLDEFRFLSPKGVRLAFWDVL